MVCFTEFDPNSTAKFAFLLVQYPASTPHTHGTHEKHQRTFHAGVRITHKGFRASSPLQRNGF